MFDKDGAIGSMFKGSFGPERYAPSTTSRNWSDCWFCVADGALGGTAQSIGGPLDKEGMIGKNFKETGTIGGMVQEKIAEKK